MYSPECLLAQIHPLNLVKAIFCLENKCCDSKILQNSVFKKLFFRIFYIKKVISDGIAYLSRWLPNRDKFYSHCANMKPRENRIQTFVLRLSTLSFSLKGGIHSARSKSTMYLFRTN